MNIKHALSAKTNSAVIAKPSLFDLNKQKDQRAVSELLRSRRVLRMSDDYEEQLREYFAVCNPTLVFSPELETAFRAYLENLERKTPLWKHGTWAYFPWSATLVHILEDKAFQHVRTARNRNLITEEEQQKFYNSVVGIAGLSVGNSIALAIVLQGGARHIKLTDHDRLALSNTNRIRTSIGDLGALKVEMTARQIYEINPYAKIDLFPEGLTKKNIERFFTGLDVIIDEIDNLAVKYLIREQAKKHRIPVVMAADNGDNGIVDIERYDKNPQTKFFHGRMGNVTYDQLASLNKLGIGRMIAKHVGPENTAPRMLQSLPEVGKTIVSWPQLGSAALLNGSAVAYCVRRIVNGQSLESNRAFVSLDEKLIPGYHTKPQIARRKKIADSFRKVFKL